MSPTKVRKTRAKEAVTHVLQSFAAPVALAELYEFIKLSLPKIAFSTVFRIIHRLESEGKVIRIEWPERGSRYEWADLPHHHHIICEACGSVADVDDNVLNFDNKRVTSGTGYRINHHSIELRGICQSCQKKGN